VAKTHSYGATLLNNATESEAIQYVLNANPSLKRPTKDERRKILEILGLPRSFARAFDLVLLPSADISEIMAVSPEALKLVELKTTKKKLMENPTGFFFGATDNEFQLAEKLGERYLFCFVSLHADSPGYKLLTAKEVEARTKTKRLQYQINL